MPEAEMTPEEVINQVRNLSGPETLDALDAKIDSIIQESMIRISSEQSQIKAFQQVKRIISAVHNVQTRPNQGTSVESGSVERVPAKVPGEPIGIEKEGIDRVTKGLCAYKSRHSEGGKWCQRSLKTKVEKEKGFCSVHLPIVFGEDSVEAAASVKTQIAASAETQTAARKRATGSPKKKAKKR